MAGSKQFYDVIHPMLFPHGLSEKQFEGIEAILDVCAAAGITDNRQVAYILATIYHECKKTMQPIEEDGKGASKDYGKKLKRGGGPGHRIPYTIPDHLYYGRGFVQLTWYENYEAQSKITGVDLLDHPELALDPTIAGKILIHGMTKGDFTGHMLSQYFNDHITDYINARKIINGEDCAQLIAGYAHTFYAGLTQQATN